MRVLETIDTLIKEQVEAMNLLALGGGYRFHILLNKKTMQKMVEEESMKKFSGIAELNLMTYHTIWGDAEIVQVLHMRDDDVSVSVQFIPAPKTDSEPVLNYI